MPADQFRLQVGHNLPNHHVRNKQTTKSKLDPENESAFEKAIVEEKMLDQRLKEKYETYIKQSIEIEENFNLRLESIKEEELNNNLMLENTLKRIINDALKFSKKNNPMIAMMPQKYTDAINDFKAEKNKRNLLNISGGSLLSINSQGSTRSAVKYESNAFLRAIGLDMDNLAPDNVKIDITKASDFMKKWKLGNKSQMEIIRYKVVNEIMNLEERRSVQKLAKINKKLNNFMEFQKAKKKASKLNEFDKVTDHTILKNKGFVSYDKPSDASELEIKNLNNLESTYKINKIEEEKNFDTKTSISKTHSQIPEVEGDGRDVGRSVSNEKEKEKEKEGKIKHSKNNSQDHTDRYHNLDKSNISNRGILTTRETNNISGFGEKIQTTRSSNVPQLQNGNSKETIDIGQGIPQTSPIMIVGHNTPITPINNNNNNNFTSPITPLLSTPKTDFKRTSIMNQQEGMRNESIKNSIKQSVKIENPINPINPIREVKSDLSFTKSNIQANQSLTGGNSSMRKASSGKLSSTNRRGSKTKRKVRKSAVEESENICKIIKSRPELAENKYLSNHFAALVNKKAIENAAKNGIRKNKIGFRIKEGEEESENIISLQTI